MFTRFSKKTLLGWFIFHWVFLLSCVLPTKAERGGRPIFTGMKTLTYCRSKKNSTINGFYARLITCSLRIVLSMVFIFASLEQIGTTKYTGLVEVTIESDRRSKKSTG